MNDLRKAAQDIIEDVDSPYIPDEIRMVDVNCIEALRKALQAEPLYTTPPSVDALIAEIDAIHPHPFQGNTLNRSEVIAILDKYRSAK